MASSTKTNIDRMNIDIVLFMGGREKSEKMPNEIKRSHPKERWFRVNNDIHCLNSLRYHDDWNWLMSVIKKLKEEIKTIGVSNDYFGTPFRAVMSALAQCDIKSVHENASELCKKFNDFKK